MGSLHLWGKAKELVTVGGLLGSNDLWLQSALRRAFTMQEGSVRQSPHPRFVHLAVRRFRSLSFSLLLRPSLRLLWQCLKANTFVSGSPQTTTVCFRSKKK